jgi:hypothetical protein
LPLEMARMTGIAAEQPRYGQPGHWLRRGVRRGVRLVSRDYLALAPVTTATPR